MQLRGLAQIARAAELEAEFGIYERALAFFKGRQPTGRLGTAEEIAAVVAFLASDDPALFTGQTIQPDGGTTI